MEKKSLLLLFLLIVLPLFIKAQTATSVLDEAASNFNKLKSLKSVYYLTLQDGKQTSRHKGCIILQGNKYVNCVDNTLVWFDGKTLWTLDKDDEEVTITSPSADELTSNNPYYFLKTYKQDFNLKLTGNSGSHYEVTMTPKKSDTNLKSIVIKVSKTDYRPVQIQMQTNKVTMVIDLQTYVANVKYKTSSFSFNKKEYPNVDIIDLR